MMLVAQAIPSILNQVLNEGAHTALLMQHDGSVIGSKTIGEETVGNGEGDADGNDKRCSSEEILLATAIEAGSLWENYSQITTQIRGGNEQRLRCLIVECEGRKLCIAEVSRLLLCIVAKPSVGLGLLRSKAALLASHFVEPFDSLFSQLDVGCTSQVDDM